MNSFFIILILVVISTLCVSFVIWSVSDTVRTHVSVSRECTIKWIAHKRCDTCQGTGKKNPSERITLSSLDKDRGVCLDCFIEWVNPFSEIEKTFDKCDKASRKVKLFLLEEELKGADK